jgi:hypothetical protein
MLQLDEEATVHQPYYITAKLEQSVLQQPPSQTAPYCISITRIKAKTRME